ncbi:MAG: hypothetical protein AAGM67_20940, partial [Bacteroidota bacterium]
MDRAPVHMAALSQNALAINFEEIIVQPGRSPDVNVCDAAIFPFLERMAQAEVSRTKDEIRSVVNKAWDQLTPVTLQRAAQRVRRNMRKVIQNSGGNFYVED